MAASSFIVGYDEDPLIPAGEHVGVYSALATMGLQPSDYGTRPNFYVEWQVTCPDGLIRTVGKRYYNLSLYPSANFRQDLEADRPATQCGRGAQV
jgi:hypothetical protein